ncbi:MAG: membrane protein insertase YidC [Candidatus Methylomirabilales bacterium]
MERRALLATILALLVLVLYQYFFMPAPPAPPPTGPEKEVAQEAKAPAVAVTSLPPAKVPRVIGPLRRGEREEEITLETDLLRVTFTNRGGGVRSWQLKQYRDASGPVDLVGPLGEGTTSLPFTAWIPEGEGREGLYRILERPGADPTKPQRVVMEFQEAGGLLVEKMVVLYPGRYLADVQVRLKNLGAVATQAALRLQWGPGFRQGAEDQAAEAAHPVAWVDGKLLTPDVEELDQELTQSGAVSFTALQDRYFAAALIPEKPTPSGLVARDEAGRPVVGLLYPATELPLGGEMGVELQVYAGPKEIARLRDAGHNLQRLVNLGWFDFVARPALHLLRFLYDFTANYGVAIIIITILQKMAFYPLTQKSLKSMQAMQALQPKIQAIRERYKNNPQKINQETMELYKRHGVNPVGGCLPMVIQIPIFIALYNALASSVELWRAPFCLWIDDLSQPDTIYTIRDLFGIQAFDLRGLPLIMGISMYIQQKMSPTSGDPRQAQMMLYLMPVMFTFLFWGFPSGLVLYWLVNNVLQVGQQYLLNRGLLISRVAGKEAE